MQKLNKKTKEGSVDLNQIRFEKNERNRPRVSANKKVPSPKKKIQHSKNSAESQMPTISEKNKKLKPIGNAGKFSRNKSINKSFIKTDENGKILITRRNLIFGAIGVGAVFAVGTGVKIATDTIHKAVNSIDTLTVEKNSVINSDSLTATDSSFFNVEHQIELPFGSLAWANSSNVITCLVPTQKAKPLAVVDLIDINSADITHVLKSSLGQKEGFEIYDVRANDCGIIWTEVNILQGEWRIYASELVDNNIVSPTMIDTGSSTWDTPTIAVSDNYAYWQVLPGINNNSKDTFLSFIKKINFKQISETKPVTKDIKTNDDIINCQNVVLTSNGRMSSAIYSYNNGIVATPRANSSNIYYQLTLINNNGNTEDSLCLPQNMKPLNAGYGVNGFNFAFDAIYNYGEGISNLGTYTPLKKPDNGYKNLKWLNFSRNPSAPPAWCNNYFIIRSTMSVCACNLENQSYCVLDRPNASDDYGDYLASSGMCNKIVTYANIYDQPVTGEEKKYCLLRVWS